MVCGGVDHQSQVRALEALKLRLASQILTAIKAHPDLLAEGVRLFV